MIERYRPKPKPRRRADTREKPLVRVTYVPGKEAYLVQEGPQQSEIRWAVSGAYEIISNEFIERISK